MNFRPALPLLLALNLVASAAAQSPVTFETARFKYTIAADGHNVAFVDTATGVNHLRGGAPSLCASIQRAGREIPVSGVALDADRLTLRFGDSGVSAVLRVAARPEFLLFTVEALAGDAPDVLTFVNVPLDLQGRPDEPFGACATALNLITRVDQLPALQTELRAAAHRKFGVVGARVALVAGPPAALPDAFKAALTRASELPVCKVAGPWAAETPFNHGSYLFNFGSLTETNVDDWIDMARSLGVTQIDNHGGSAAFFKFGDFALNPQKWPDGWDSFARIVGRLHAAGIGSIFHSYAFFIDKQSKYVTPVPDPRLDAFRVFTLTADLDATADSVTVNESTAGLTTVTGFFEFNSVVLHVGDELMTFGGVSAQAPWRFTGLKRGAFGTKAAAHPAGRPARQLKECFGLFVPNVESTLFEEIAANHAAVVNRCGFDGLYLDAIDGSAILRGNEECWYWANKFVVEIQKRLWRPVGMEMSAMWHQFWQYRTRWQAWDFPRRGHERFIDLHAAGVNGGLMLPLHLGWWSFNAFSPPQVEPTYPEVIDYLGARLIGWDAGISLAGGVDRDQLRTVPLFRRDVDRLRSYETLRHAGTVPERVKAALREPGREFVLVTNHTGQARFQRSASTRHPLSSAEPWTLHWSVTNAFADQPARFRLEALMGVAPDNETNGVVLADRLPAGGTGWQQTNAAGVTGSWTNLPADASPLATVLTARHEGGAPQRGAWLRFERRHEPPLKLHHREGLRFWVEGDGSGALLAIRLESPRHLAYGAVADRYLPLDFTGRREVTLLETESARWSDYDWGDGKALYHLYREGVEFDAIDSVSVWLQNLPAGREVTCRLGPIRAVPMQEQTLRRPALSVNGTTITFEVELPAGGWIEANGPEDCQAFGPKGEPRGAVKVTGAWPQLRAGANAVEFRAPAAEGPAVRARVTVFARGEEL